MTDTISNNKRIAKNTIVLYFRMLFMMAVTLYTSRVVINALGFENYGIYSAVGGFVAMFGVISNALTAAISRFITFEIGSKNEQRLKRIFTTALMIQSIIACIVCLLIESGGVWFLNYHMTIPSNRLMAANIVLQLSVLTFLIQLISVPYNAIIVAHERMTAYALISIFNAVGTLAVAWIVQYSTSVDQLTLYALLLSILTLIVRIIYGIYCNKHFAESKFKFTFDKPLIKEILSFAGWNFFGASSAVLRDQGINVLLNVFCGPVVNAARGISMQVNGAIHSFSGSFLMALNPQITKNFAAGNRPYTMNLVFQGARFSFYLLLLLSLPILVETEQVLSLWLGRIPNHTVNFVRLIIIYAMTEAISSTLITVMLATGTIKRYQIIVGGTQLLNFPVALLLLYLGLAPEYTMVSTILIALLCLCFRLVLLKGMIQLSIGDFLRKVIINILMVSLASMIIPILFTSCIEKGFFRFLISCVICIISAGVSIYFVGCSMNERQLIYNKIITFVNKCKNYIR